MYLTRACLYILTLLLISQISLASGLMDLEDGIQFKNWSVSEGLSQGYAFDIIQDHQGFIWIATQDGLNRFDGQQFKLISESEGGIADFKGRDFRALYEDDQGNLWIGTNGQGVNILNISTQRNRHLDLIDQQNPNALTNAVIIIKQSSDGNIWVGTRNGLVVVDPLRDYKKSYIKLHNQQQSLVGNRIRDISFHNNHAIVSTGSGLYKVNLDSWHASPILPKDHALANVNSASLQIDSFGSYWLGTFTKGIYQIDSQTFEFKNYQNIANSEATFRKIREVLIDKGGDIWATSELQGLLKFDKNLNQFKAFRPNQGRLYSLQTGNTVSLFQDQAGLFWLGTLGDGVYTFDSTGQKVIHMIRNTGDSLDNTPRNIWAINHDKNKGYWLGSNGDGLSFLDSSSGQIKSIKPARVSESFHFNQVWAIAQEDENHLWLATWSDGVFLYNKQTNDIQSHYHRKSAKYPFLDSGALDVLKRSNGDTLFGTRTAGLLVHNPETKKVRAIDLNLPNSPAITSSKIFDVYEDAQGNIWLGTEYQGLIKMSGQYQPLKNWKHNPSNPNSLPSNTVISIAQDSQGRMLLGTDKGFAIQLANNHFIRLTKKDGLINEAINGITVGCDKKIWLSTDNGISSYDPSSNRIINYSSHSGDGNKVFNSNAIYQNSVCEIILGGTKGLTVFKPQENEKSYKAPLKLVDVMKYKKSIVTEQPLNQIERLELDYEDNLLTLKFALLDYDFRQQHQYYYRLPDQHKQWINLGQQNYIDFYNLQPGTHLVEVRARSGDNPWSNTLQYTLVVEPPIWLSHLAYTIYIFLFCLLSTLLAYAQFNKIRLLKTVAESERKIARNLRDIDRLKDQFLANTSHELRTPLNAVIGLSDMVLTEGIDQFSRDELQEHFSIIKVSGEHLLSLVSDILDYSAINAGKVNVDFQTEDLEPIISKLLNELKLVYKDSALDIQYRLQAQFPSFEMDKKRLYQILLNLLNNAIKFTQKGFVHLNATYDDTNIVLHVIDSGTGIPAHKITQIFERFEQVDGSDQRQFGGAGLGLAITKELVELHHGSITVKSIVNQGTTFTVTLPRRQNR
jgi:two-component system, sensor histidine kinase ChiS